MSSEDNLLSKKALGKQANIAPEIDYYKITLKVLFKVIDKFMKGPGKNWPGSPFIKYYKKEIEILFLIVKDVKRTDAIEGKVDQLKKSMQMYIEEVQRINRLERELPEPPGFIDLILVPAYKDNLQFLDSYNRYLDDYESGMQSVIDYAINIKSDGETLISELPKDIEKLRKEIEIIPNSTLTPVIKERLNKELDFLMIAHSDIMQLRGQLDDIVKRAERRKNIAQNTQRLKPSGFKLNLR